MEQFQLNLLKHLNQITPNQLSQLSPQQLAQLRELTQLTQFAQKQNQQKSTQNQQTLQQNLQLQQQELLRLQAQQQQNQTQQLTQQQLVQQQLSQNINFSSGFPPTLVPPQSPANLYAYGYVQGPLSSNANGPTNTEAKYKQLLAVIEEMGKDIRPIYSGSKTGAERFKRLIIQARMLVRECLLEAEKSNR